MKKPYYLLVYNYMIGDADGDTKKEVIVSINNPYLERYVTLLDKLQPTNGTWGIVFDEDDFRNFLIEKQLTQEEYDFMTRMMFEMSDSPFDVPKENEKYADQFFEGVYGNTEYSFLVFQGVKLFYIDEKGKKHKAKIK